MADDSMIASFLVAKLAIQKLLGEMPYGEAEIGAIERLDDEMEGWRSGFTQFLLHHERKLLSGQWTIFLLRMLGNWSEGTWRLVDQLDPIWDLFSEDDEEAEESTAHRHVFAALAALGKVEFRDFLRSLVPLGQQLASLVALTEAKAPENAYDLAAIAVFCFNEAGDLPEDAENASSAAEAIAGGKAAQLAVARLEAARGSIRRARSGRALREEAFRSIERAVEAVLAMPDGWVREHLISRILSLLREHVWLQPAGLALMMAAQPEARQRFSETFSFDFSIERINRFEDVESMALFISNLMPAGLAYFEAADDTHGISIIMEAFRGPADALPEDGKSFKDSFGSFAQDFEAAASKALMAEAPTRLYSLFLNNNHAHL